MMYADPDTGALSDTPAPGWIAHTGMPISAPVIPCALHGATHPVPPRIVFWFGDSYGAVVRALAAGLQPAARFDPINGRNARTSVARLLQELHGSFGRRVGFRQAIARAAAFPADDPRALARRAPADMRAWDRAVFAIAAAQVALVLGYPAYRTCEHAALAYSAVTRAVMAPVAHDDHRAERLLARIAQTLHAFLDDPIAHPAALAPAGLR